MWEKKRYHELFFMIDTCQASTMVSKIYSPNVLAVGSSLKGQNSYSYGLDLALGVPLIDRFTHYVLDYMEQVTRTSHQTLQDMFLRFDPREIHSDPLVRSDLFRRPLASVRITDFLGSVAQVEMT